MQKLQETCKKHAEDMQKHAGNMQRTCKKDVSMSAQVDPHSTFRPIVLTSLQDRINHTTRMTGCTTKRISRTVNRTAGQSCKIFTSPNLQMRPLFSQERS